MNAPGNFNDIVSGQFEALSVSAEHMDNWSGLGISNEYPGINPCSDLASLAISVVKDKIDADDALSAAFAKHNPFGDASEEYAWADAAQTLADKRLGTLWWINNSIRKGLRFPRGVGENRDTYLTVVSRACHQQLRRVNDDRYLPAAFKENLNSLINYAGLFYLLEEDLHFDDLPRP